MSDLQHRHFYRDVIPLLEEIVELIDENDFENEEDSDDEEALAEKSTLNTFINLVRDSLIIAEENS